MISFRCEGIPRPKGSGFVAMCSLARKIKCGGKPFATQTSQRRDKAGKLTAFGRLWEWTQKLRIAQRPVSPVAPFSGAVELRAVFSLERPASRTKDPYPIEGNAPDLDKLLRALLDAIQVAVKSPGMLLRDDAQVCKVVAEKRWATDKPGVEVEIVPLEPEQGVLL